MKYDSLWCSSFSAWEQLIGPPAGPSCCPPSSRWSLFQHTAYDKKLSWHYNKWSFGLCGEGSAMNATFEEATEGCSLCVFGQPSRLYANTHMHIWMRRYTWHAGTPLNIHEKADKINPNTQLTFIWKEQPLKTCWVVDGRHRGGAWGDEGWLISMPLTPDSDSVTQHTWQQRWPLTSCLLGPQHPKKKQFTKAAKL